MIEPRLAYNYALIDETGWCYEVRTTSRNCDGWDGYISIPEYSYAYMDKYYNIADGKWYLEASFSTEWIPE